jgi:hypothetical protein
MIEVNILNINKVVLEGEPLSVDVEVTNTGTENLQDVEIELLNFSGTVVDSVIISPSTDELGSPLTEEFEAGETEQVNLQWNISIAESDIAEITIQSVDDSVKQLILGTLSFTDGVSYVEQGSEKRLIGQVNVLTGSRDVADKVKTELSSVNSGVKNEVVSNLESTL